MERGLHELYEHEYVQILFDEVLKPKMQVGEQRSFQSVSKRLWQKNNIQEKKLQYDTAKKTVKEQIKQLKREIAGIEAALEGAEHSDRTRLYRAQHRLAKAKVTYHAISLQVAVGDMERYKDLAR